ncbi:MAG TPA: ATP-binding protein [Rariglobus sp.]|nr:ATP-binding protein [Rariglobus sp.]
MTIDGQDSTVEPPFVFGEKIQITPQAPAALAPSAPSIETSGDQITRALVNQGDTVRASWRFSLDAIRANIGYMSPEAKELMVWAFTWCIDVQHPLHFESFCERVDYKPNTVYKMFSGKYKHPTTSQLMDAPEDFVKNLRSFRRLEVLRAKQGQQKFVFMPTTNRIYWAIDQARKSRRPVMIYGGSQIGKTESFKQNCIDFNHGKTVLIEIEAVNGLRGLLQAIATKLGVSPNANTPDLIERICKALTPDMVLILDEVHLLANVYRKGSFFACMEQIRRIWDRVKFGLVLSYTDLGFEKAEKERKRELVQIFRRGVLQVNLGPAPTVEDVKALCTGYGFDWDLRREYIEVDKGVGDKPIAALRQLANENGITAIIERIRIANEIAADAGRLDVGWDDFLTAHFSVKKQSTVPATGWEKEAA